MAYTRDFTKEDDLFVGDDIALSFEVFEDDLEVDDEGEYVSGTPIDVSAWTFLFVVRTTDTTPATAVLTKATSSGITITGTFDANHTSNTQRVVIAIPDTDTFSDLGAVLIPPKPYRYSLKRTNAGSEKTVARGKFVLQEVPARA